jgi:hypothetical protein
MSRLFHKWPLLTLFLLLPQLAMANMNGGLRISNWVIFLALFLLILFIVSFFLSFWNLRRKSRGIRVFTIIVWLPLLTVCLWIMQTGATAWPVIIPLLQAFLILGSLPPKKTADETTDPI